MVDEDGTTLSGEHELCKRVGLQAQQLFKNFFEEEGKACEENSSGVLSKFSDVL